MNTRIAVVLTFVAILLGVAFVQLPSEPAVETASTFHVSLAIDGILPLHQTDVAGGTTALELLREESTEEGFALIEKEYAGLGTLVEAIGTSTNGTDGKYWTYTVNGQFAQKGADAYALQSGDAIEWTFKVPDLSY